jgi:proline iminopeptidase
MAVIWRLVVCKALPESERAGDVVEAYARRLNHPDSEIREQAAYAWCLWESATIGWPPIETLSPRFNDPVFRLAFARLVTHYMVHGRFDFQAPIGNAWELHRLWPASELIVVDDAGHATSDTALVNATSVFALRGNES